MFEIGFAELFLLGVIALLVVGPDRLPALARTVGVWVGRAQRLVGQVRADIEREVRADELRRAAKEYSPTAALSDMRKEVEDFASEVSKPVDIDAKKAESANSGTSDTEPTGPAAAPASDATDTADTNTAPGSGSGRTGRGGGADRGGRARFHREARRRRIRAGDPCGVLGGSGRRCERWRTGVGRAGGGGTGRIGAGRVTRREDGGGADRGAGGGGARTRGRFPAGGRSGRGGGGPLQRPGGGGDGNGRGDGRPGDHAGRAR